MKQIQATFMGYGGKPCSLFSAYDIEANVLVISAEADYRTERRKDCFVITNEASINRDKLFTEDDLAEAIQAYYSFRRGVAVDGKSPRLVFGERAARANPDQSIEMDGIAVGGAKYRLAEGITSSQVAALATCLYASQSETVERSVRLASRFREVAMGRILSI